jgi:azurin
MKKTLSILTCLVLFVGCDSQPEKEKFTRKESKTTVINLTTDNGMKFSQETIKVKSGQTINLTLKHMGNGTKESWGHNFVLLKKDIDVNDFAARASVSVDSDYIPEGNDIIAKTQMIGGGETVKITFSAPLPGIYDFLCTFPGHSQMMRGKFIVE